MRRSREFLSGLLRDEQGTSLIEMSFILPVLIMLGCGAADLALCYARGLTLQQAAARSMEFAIAYGVKSQLSTKVQTEAASAAGVPSGNVAVDFWLECDGVRQLDPNGACSASTPARYISVTIRETHNWMFEKIVPSWNSAPYSVPLRGFARVRIQ